MNCLLPETYWGHWVQPRSSIMVKPKVQNIQESLKEMMREEIKKLPVTIKKLEPQQRLNILCKLIPFVLPRVESIHHREGE